MINFEEELKKFHPSLEVEDIADLLLKKIMEPEQGFVQEYEEEQ